MIQTVIMYFLQMVEVEIPQSLLEEQGRQLYGVKLLEVQVSKLNVPSFRVGPI